MPITSDDPCWFYRCYSASDELLYIGVAKNPRQRATDHASEHRSWWGEVAYVEYGGPAADNGDAPYPDRASAEASELAAIRAESPRYNIAGTIGPDDRERYTWRIDNDQALRLDTLVFELRAELGIGWQRPGRGRGPLNRADVLDALVRIAAGHEATRRLLLVELHR